MVSVSDISEMIENELKITPWGERQWQIYRSVYTILKRHEEEAASYRIRVKDREALSAHLEQQPWYENSRNKSILIGMIKEMNTLGKNESDGSFKLTANFPRHGGLYLKIKYRRSDTRLQLVVYIQDSTESQSAYFVNYDSMAALSERVELPQFRELSRFLPSSLSRLTHLEQVQLVATIVDFYDQNREFYPKIMDSSNPPLMAIPLNKHTDFNLAKFNQVMPTSSHA